MKREDDPYQEKHLGNGCYAPRKLRPKKVYICSVCGFEKVRQSFPSGDDKSTCKNCIKTSPDELRLHFLHF